MKKTLLALAVLAAAGSVNAAEVYNDGEGFSVEIGADVDVQYYKDQTEDSEAAIQIDDADFDMSITSQINDDVAAIGYIDFDGEDADADDSTVNLDDAYVGFESATKGTITVGNQATILDDAGIGDDYEFGITAAVDDFDLSGTEVVKYKYSDDTWAFGVAYMGDDGDADDASLVDAMVGYTVGDFEGRIFVGQAEVDGEKDTAAIFEIDYQATEDLLIQGTYGTANFENGVTATQSDDLGEDLNVDVVGLTLTYSATDDVTLAAGISSLSGENNQDDDDYTSAFVNVGYAIATNVDVYAEYGFTNSATLDDDNADWTENDNGFVVGMSVEF